MPKPRPQHTKDEFLFLGHAVGDRHHELLAHQGRQGGQGNSRVARTGLDEVLAIEFSALCHAFEQVGGRAVLDGAERIEPFQLYVQLKLPGGTTRQSHDWRRVRWIGDQLANIVVAPQRLVGTKSSLLAG